MRSAAAAASAAFLSRDLFSASPPPAARPAGAPNILIVFADDAGWGEIGAQGFAADIPTPHIDSIARNGVKFTNGYVTCPVCSPSRAGLLTGRYQNRFGFEVLIGKNAQDEDYGVPRDEPMISEQLKKAGYATGMAGKWHVGYQEGLRPTERGFDEFFGFLGGGHNYLSNRKDVLRGTEEINEPGYMTDALGREAVAFIEKHKAEPFFYYLSFNAVHAPLVATDEYLSRFAHIEDKKRRTYAAMTAAMDEAVGKALAALRENQLEENTLVFFLSDNGGPTPQTTSSNKPLRGYKQQVFEGGIRIPFYAQWKGVLPEGAVYEKPVISLDIAATAYALAGIESPSDKPLDGVNLIPFLVGEDKGMPHDCLFWRYRDQRAIRRGDWKLMTCNAEFWLLFNLADDLSEERDLSQQHPELARELLDEWNAWSAQMMEPRWNRKEPDLEWIESVGGLDPTRPPASNE